MAKFEITLADSIFIRNHDGKALSLPVADLSPEVIAKIAEVGAKTILTNVWNGGGKAATDAERLAAFNKKIDAWKRGEFNVVERGESQYSAFKEVWLQDCLAAGMTAKAAEDGLKAKVVERLGKDAKATFANFIEASALEYADGGEMTVDEARTALEAYYAKEADERAKTREATKVQMPTIDLAAFKKPAA